MQRPGFVTKRQAAEYLNESLQPEIIGGDLFQDVGLWSWLTLFYFEDVCPPKDGKRAPLQAAHYIPEPWDHRRSYMHLLASSLRILQLAPVHNQIFLQYPPSVRSEVMQAMMSRLFLMRIPCVPEAIEILYYDPSRQRPKVRALNPKQSTAAGDLTNRFHTRIRQLQRTYDLWVLSAEQLIRLLGHEFDRWKGEPKLQFPAAAATG